MFEIEQKNNEEITLTTKQTKIIFDVAQSEIRAEMAVGKIAGPGEFEIGDVLIRGIGTPSGKTVYEAEVAGMKIGILGGVEEGLDEFEVSDVLCTSSVRAVREIGPKMVVAMDSSVERMTAELKQEVGQEKKLKIKNRESLPAEMTIVSLR